MEILDPKFSNLSETFDQIFAINGINTMNEIFKRLDNEDIDSKKLAAAIDYAGVTSADDVGILIDYIDDFGLIEDVSYGDDEAVGRYFVESDFYDEYEISDELEDFLDYSEFGAYIAETRSGEHVPGGFIFYDGNNDISEILDQLGSADSSMRMGGM